MVALGYLAVLLVVMLAIHIFTLHKCCGLFQSKVSPLRVTMLVLGLVLGTAAVQAFTVYSQPPRHLVGMLVLAELLLMFGIAFVLYHYVLHLSWRNAVTTWLIAFGVYVGATVVIGVPVRLFAVEAFKSPTNSMAPTLLGQHYIAVCPECGGEAIVPGSEVNDLRDFETIESATWPTICRDCLKTTEISGQTLSSRGEGDRFFVDKTAQPKRWDLLVFRPPGDPQVLYVQRIVALSREAISIRAGRIYIDDELATPPSEIADLRYTNIPSLEYLQHDRESFTLGTGEYFVLGDNSPLARDSRDFGPVPKENVVGVVTLLYWPPHRWRVFE